MSDSTRTESYGELSRRAQGDAAGACVVFIDGPQLGRLIALDEDPLVLGRGDDCDVLIDGAGVSRRHCRFWRDDAGHYVEDLGSTNGTRVNDEKVPQALLRDGDLIAVGDSVLKYVGERNVEARYHNELHEQITRDNLTNLFNRSFFTAMAEAEVLRASRYRRPLSLVLLDIDHFKLINDTFGHPAGDSVLQRLADTLRSRVRRGDSLFRIGGEELALLLPETPVEIATSVAESYRQLVETTPFRIDRRTVQVTVSLGVAEWCVEMAGVTDLFALADRRLYQAKAGGRNRVEPPPAPPAGDGEGTGAT
jgi:diguanylate cyclase (GGDEF)-like protein